MSDTPPKSAIELAMERLDRKDAEAGTQVTELTDEQREQIAEVRRICEAKTAERRMLRDSTLAGTFEPEARQELERECRADLERFANSRDRKIEEIRGRSA